VARKSTRSGRSAKGNSKPTQARAARPASTASTPRQRRRGRPTRQETKLRQAEYARFQGERVIHRYGNRRFYDLEGRRAVTLGELGGLIRQGQNVRVLDVDASGADITRRVLMQIILEDERSLAMLPVEFLRKLIGTKEQEVAGWLDSFLKIGAELLHRTQREGIALTMTYQAQVALLLRGIMPTTWPKYPDLTVRNRVRDREIEDLRRRLEELAKQHK